MIAAKVAGKKLKYSSYKNEIKKKQFEKLYQAILEKKFTIKQLLEIINIYGEKYSKPAYNLYF